MKERIETFEAYAVLLPSRESGLLKLAITGEAMPALFHRRAVARGFRDALIEQAGLFGEIVKVRATFHLVQTIDRRTLREQLVPHFTEAAARSALAQRG